MTSLVNTNDVNIGNSVYGHQKKTRIPLKGPKNLKYRAEIDGLRALAVAPVIFFHAGFELFGGGFVGVDVFFVISGYLITTILIEDIQAKRFNIINFYERRVRRILPALFFVMLICIPLAAFLLQPDHLFKFSIYVSVSMVSAVTPSIGIGLAKKVVSLHH